MIVHELQSRPEVTHLLRKPAAGALSSAALVIGATNYATPFGWPLSLFAFFFLCVACGNDLGGLLRTRGALVLGECYFGIYLLHGILLSLAFVEGSDVLAGINTDALPVLLPILAVPLVAVTAFTYRFVERPAIRFGSVLASRWSSRTSRVRVAELEVAP